MCVLWALPPSLAPASRKPADFAARSTLSRAPRRHTQQWVLSTSLRQLGCALAAKCALWLLTLLRGFRVACWCALNPPETHACFVLRVYRSTLLNVLVVCVRLSEAASCGARGVREPQLCSVCLFSIMLFVSPRGRRDTGRSPGEAHSRIEKSKIQAYTPRPSLAWQPCALWHRLRWREREGTQHQGTHRGPSLRHACTEPSWRAACTTTVSHIDCTWAATVPSRQDPAALTFT